MIKFRRVNTSKPIQNNSWYLVVLLIIVFALLLLIEACHIKIKVVENIPDSTIPIGESKYPQIPGFVFCVDGENAMVYEKSVGPIEISSDGYLTFEGEDDIIRIKDDNCVIRWRKK